jgi:hypothetical protein
VAISESEMRVEIPRHVENPIALFGQDIDAM